MADIGSRSTRDFCAPTGRWRILTHVVVGVTLALVVGWVAGLLVAGAGGQVRAGDREIGAVLFATAAGVFALGLAHEHLHALALRSLGARPVVAGGLLRPYCVAPDARLTRAAYAYYSLLPLALLTPAWAIPAAVFARATESSWSPSLALACLFLGWFHTWASTLDLWYTLQVVRQPRHARIATFFDPGRRVVCLRVFPP